MFRTLLTGPDTFSNRYDHKFGYSIFKVLASERSTINLISLRLVYLQIERNCISTICFVLRIVKYKYNYKFY